MKFIGSVFVLVLLACAHVYTVQEDARAERMAAKELGCEHKIEDACRGVK